MTFMEGISDENVRNITEYLSKGLINHIHKR